MNQLLNSFYSLRQQQASCAEIFSNRNCDIFVFWAGCLPVSQEIGKFCLKVKWNCNFPQNPFGSYRPLPEEVISFRSGARFSKLPVIIWPVRQFCFSFQSSFKRFENYTANLSAKETKWTLLEVTTHPTFLENLISKYDFGPVQLTGLSRNGPQNRKAEIDQFRYIKIQPQTIDLSTRLWRMTTEFVGFIIV